MIAVCIMDRFFCCSSVLGEFCEADASPLGAASAIEAAGVALSVLPWLLLAVVVSPSVAGDASTLRAWAKGESTKAAMTTVTKTFLACSFSP